jgi:hypothetical protein
MRRAARAIGELGLACLQLGYPAAEQRLARNDAAIPPLRRRDRTVDRRAGIFRPQGGAQIAELNMLGHDPERQGGKLERRFAATRLGRFACPRRAQRRALSAVYPGAKKRPDFVNLW